jgi:hypothetical protein
MEHRHPRGQPQITDRTFQETNSSEAGVHEQPARARERPGEHQTRDPAATAQIHRLAGKPRAQNGPKRLGLGDMTLYRPRAEKAPIPTVLEDEQ